jgi:hypothetical protein
MNIYYINLIFLYYIIVLKILILFTLFLNIYNILLFFNTYIYIYKNNSKIYKILEN